MEKSIKFKAKNIINIREEICKKKKDYWLNIRNTNLLSTKEVKDGYRKYDLKALYNEIMQMSEKLVYIKGMLAALNTGTTTFDKDAFKKTNNYNIFMATEIKEAIAQLKMIPTIDPATKSKKGGAAKMGKNEVFTSAKIAQLIKDLNLKATKYNNNMEEFNTNTDIDITSIADMFKDDLTILKILLTRKMVHIVTGYERIVPATSHKIGLKTGRLSCLFSFGDQYTVTGPRAA